MKNRFFGVLLFLGLITLFGLCIAQEPIAFSDTIPEAITNPKANINLDVPDAAGNHWTNDTSLVMAILISIVCLAILVMEFFLIKSDKIKNEHAVRVYLVTIIIYGSIFLVAAGYDNNHIAPIIGLLGTIAGYMLSGLKNEKPSNNEE
jgi:hypothetical protein